MMLDGLFDGFDKAQIDAIRNARKDEIAETGRAKALKKAHRLQVRRAKSEATLADILPQRVESGESWHVISHGDIDSLSYLAHLLRGVEFFDYVAISTWCMGSADLDMIEGWIESGRIETLAIYVGEIFPAQYGDEYARAIELAERYGFRLVVARNHSKVMLARSGGGVSPGHGIIRQRQYQSAHRTNSDPRIARTVRFLPRIFRRTQDH